MGGAGATGNGDKAGELVKRAGAMATLDRHDEALAEYDRAVATDPGHAGAHHGRGRMLAKLGRHDEAIGAFRRALEADPELPAAPLDEGRALSALSRHEEALAAYDRVLGISASRGYYAEKLPEADLAHAGRGDALRQLGRHEEAVDAYDSAIGREEQGRKNSDVRIGLDHAQVLYGRALSLLELDRLYDAVADCEAATEISPGHVQAHRTLVTALLEFERSDERPLEGLLAAIDRAIGVDPDYAPAHAGRGDAICELGCHAYAVAEYDRAIELDPNHAGAHHGRGRALSRLGRHEEALGALRRALEIDPELPGASLAEGHALLSLGRLDEALAAFDHALSARPSACINDDGQREAGPAWKDLPQVHVGRGMSLSRLGRHDEALLAFKEAVKTEHGYDTRTRFCFQYELAPTYALLGMPLTKRDNSAGVTGMDRPIYALLGMTLTKLGRHEDALAKYESAYSSWTEIPEARRARAESLRALGQHDAVHEAHRNASGLGGFDNVSPREARARAESLRALGQHDEALVEYDRISAFRDNDPATRRAHAMTLQSLGHHEMALAAYDRAIELDPDHAMARRDRASVLLSLKRPTDALESLDRAAELAPGDAELHACRAHVLDALGLRPEAEEARRRAESPDPT